MVFQSSNRFKNSMIYFITFLHLPARLFSTQFKGLFTSYHFLLRGKCPLHIIIVLLVDSIDDVSGDSLVEGANIYRMSGNV